MLAGHRFYITFQPISTKNIFKGVTENQRGQSSFPNPYPVPLPADACRQILLTYIYPLDLVSDESYDVGMHVIT